MGGLNSWYFWTLHLDGVGAGSGKEMQVLIGEGGPDMACRIRGGAGDKSDVYFYSFLTLIPPGGGWSQVKTKQTKTLTVTGG